MAKTKTDYFQLIQNQASYCVKASTLLETIICNYSPDTIAEQKNAIHAIEHEADSVYYDISNKLSTEFITTIDQEDILRLTQIIDDITDSLDEAALELYVYCIDTLPDDAKSMANAVVRCTTALYESIKELKNFKKPDALWKLLGIVSDLESETDLLYADSVRSLFGTACDCKTLLGTKSIYESLENCCDLCDHAAKVIQQVLIKNT